MTRGVAFLDSLEQAVYGAVVSRDLDAIDPWIEVAPDRLLEVCRWLKEHSSVRFDSLQCVTAVDWFERDEKKAAKVPWKPHLQLVYHLWSTVARASLVIKCNLQRWEDDVPGRLPSIASVAGIWRTADWHEREVYDLSGIVFTGHPDLRRILCPEDWVGHPLRKDYEQPLEYHGIRGR
ncbi:MAG: NADH-quinone oxidoreductase subunit C [Planctomycetaceae bacterium]